MRVRQIFVLTYMSRTAVAVFYTRLLNSAVRVPRVAARDSEVPRHSLLTLPVRRHGAQRSLSLLLSPRPTSRATHVSQHLHLPAGVQRIVRSIVAERAGSQIPEGAVPAAARGACEWPGTCAGLAPPSRHNPSHPAIAAGPVLRTQRHDVPMEVHALCLPPRASVRSCLQTARKPKARVFVVRVDRLQLRG